VLGGILLDAMPLGAIADVLVRSLYLTTPPARFTRTARICTPGKPTDLTAMACLAGGHRPLREGGRQQSGWWTAGWTSHAQHRPRRPVARLVRTIPQAASLSASGNEVSRLLADSDKRWTRLLVKRAGKSRDQAMKNHR